MKWLFERLSQAQYADQADTLVASVNQLLSTHHQRDSLQTPGIFNFGLPNSVDYQHSEQALRLYAEKIQQRIVEFEPRLHQVSVEVQSQGVLIEARIRDTNQPFSWQHV